MNPRLPPGMKSQKAISEKIYYSCSNLQPPKAVSYIVLKGFSTVA
jgi:hypothetical protein